MNFKYTSCIGIILFLFFISMPFGQAQQTYSKRQIDKLKSTIEAQVGNDHKKTQVMIDKVFSFAELGFQEYETSTYLTGILEAAGFTIERGISGIPTAWMARWSQGEGPVIALGSDVDCIPKASQYPGVSYHKPMVEGAPGHGEGHNSGLPVIVTAALNVQDIMQKITSEEP